MVADAAGPVEAALDERLRTDEHAVTDLKRLYVLERHAGLDTNSMLELATRGPPDSAAHDRVQLPVAESEPCVELDQPGRSRRTRLGAPTGPS